MTLGLAMAATMLSGCSGLNNAVSSAFGGTGFARLIDASPATTQTNITLMADHGIINSGVSNASRIGPYAKVSAGNVAFDINTGTGTNDLVPAINVNVAASTNYSIVLEGEPGLPDYQAVSFQDSGALNNPATVRFKVNNAAPNLATPVDVYIWNSANGIPGTPTVAGLALNQDTGSTPSHPGNSYIPVLGSTTTLPSGNYDIAIVPAGSIPNGTSDLFDGVAALATNNSYSFTIFDRTSTQNDIGVMLSIDEPFQTGNQAVIVRHPVR